MFVRRVEEGALVAELASHVLAAMIVRGLCQEHGDLLLKRVQLRCQIYLLHMGVLRKYKRETYLMTQVLIHGWFLQIMVV